PGEKRDILIALDDSELSEHTLFWSFDNLLDDGDKATIVTVPKWINALSALEVGGQGVDVKSLIAAHLMNEEEDMALTGIQTLLKRAKAHFLKNVEVTVKVQSGDPRQVVLNMTKTLNPTMLVVGSRGPANIPGVGLLLGSVSSYLTTHAEVPVVIVRYSTPTTIE
ncbi:hypothetical protein HK096_008484, partial [Nowakowskiella sp. JEL0078]